MPVFIVIFIPRWLWFELISYLSTIKTTTVHSQGAVHALMSMSAGLRALFQCSLPIKIRAAGQKRMLWTTLRIVGGVHVMSTALPAELSMILAFISHGLSIIVHRSMCFLCSDLHVPRCKTLSPG